MAAPGAPAARVRVIALSGADPALARRLAAAGDSPALAGLLARGALAETRAPQHVYAGAAWTTLWTATTPERHGRTGPARVDLDSYAVVPAPEPREPALWDRAEQAGLSVWAPGGHAQSQEATPAEVDLCVVVLTTEPTTGAGAVLEHRRLDGLLAEQTADLRPEDTAFVVLALGTAARFGAAGLLDDVLARLDWSLDVPDGLGATTRAVDLTARLLPPTLRRPALRGVARLVGARGTDGVHSALPPREDRRWFALPSGVEVGAVRLNLAGREALGRVAPADRSRVLRWLSGHLRELVDLDTGRSVVRRCAIADAGRTGAPADLYVEWEPGSRGERVWSPATGTVTAPAPPAPATMLGPEGFLLAVGPGIRPGSHHGTFPLEDVGATIAAAVGVPLDERHGRPIAALLPRGAVVAPPPRVRAALGVLARRLPATRTPGWAGRDAAGARVVVAELRRSGVAMRIAAAGAEERADAMSARADIAEARLAVVEERLTVAALLSEQVVDVGWQLSEAARRLAELEGLVQVGAMTAWLAQSPGDETLMVSVITATRNRRPQLEAAIASVLAQSHARWELLVVDDGSRDDTAEFVTACADPRVRLLRSGGDGMGAGAARNVGLQAATGDVIAYLDDDNRFDPHWLKAVAATFRVRPDAYSVYGVRVVDDDGRLFGGDPSGRPWIHFVAWDADAVATGNLADMNIIAHRRGTLRFDESIAYHGDWDLLVRLAQISAPVPLPAIGAYYHTDGPGRLTNTTPADVMKREIADIRRRATALAQRLAEPLA